MPTKLTHGGNDNDEVGQAPLGRKALNHRRRQIAGVLVRRGWGYLLEASGLEHLAALEPHREADSQVTGPERLRLALEELGPTFIKLGQLLSTRADLLGPEFRLELAKLQDDAPHLPSEVVREVVRTELGEPETVFAAFDPEPLAAASIGQAHAATMPDGTEVVVKIRRPGAMEEVELDLEILANCAAHASRRSERMAEYDLVGIAEEFAQTTRAELDYLREGRNAEQFAANFADDADVQIPRVFWERTTSRVITLERIRGSKITDLDALDEASIDRCDLAKRATDVIAKMVFQDRFFHADPHPGNFFIQAGGRIGLIDFGMVGTLNAELRDQLGKLMVALVRGDADRLAASLLGLGAATASVDRERLRDDLAELLARYSDRGLGSLDFGVVSGEILEIVRRHHLRPPRDLALLLKAFVMDEGMAEQLDPDFRLVEELRPYVYRHLVAELSPAALARRAGQAGVDLAELAVDFPGQLLRILELAASGGFEVHLRTAELEPLVGRAERLANRIAAAVLAAAVIDGLAELSATRTRPHGRRRLRLSTAVAGLGAFAGDVARRRLRARVR
ncbi:MAG TPA: AarF/ABC1/UbiB kinase family protein [Solirubrobacteraceae bacterium]|nr:AarF/ABC1/UbiB kinase family protein [Solirubrobacteraceae bacterium]